MTTPEILFEDEDLMVVNKPGGVVVNRAQSTSVGETIQEWHMERNKIREPKGIGDSEFFQKGGIVHRLDRDTSGVMILAKNEAAYEALKKQFLERTTTKKYLAMVHGIMKAKEGVIAAPIERLRNMNSKFGIGTDPARMGVTDWKVLEEGGGVSLVELIPHTGRTHQLRVHMKHLGHPILSDPIYGGKQAKKDVEICPRLFLHARELTFRHPKSDRIEKFEAELPPELEEAKSRLLHLEK